MHGTTSSYKRGCRCDECRAAWAAYMRDWTARNKDKVAASAARSWRNLTPEQRETRRQYMRRYEADHPELREKLAERKRRYRQDPEYRKRENSGRSPEAMARASRKHLLKKLYGLTPEEYDAKLAAQDGKCAICGRVPNGRQHAVDHDHATGAVRGLLCHPCNMALGALQDGALFAAARKYLRRYSQPT